MDIRKSLNINIESPFWDEALQEALASPKLPAWLRKDFVSALEKDFSLLGDCAEPVLQALDQVVKTPALCLLAKVLYHIIDRKKSFSQLFSCFALPNAPEGATETLGYDYVGLFPILGHVSISNRELADRGVEQDIISATLQFLRLQLKESREKAGKPCFTKDSFSLFRLYVYTNYLWFSRMRFEIHKGFNRNVKVFRDGSGNVRILMHDAVLHRDGNILGAIGYTDEAGAFDADFRETEDYYEGYAVNPETGLAETKRTRLSKKDWTCILQPGDTLLKVHIPYGGKLSKQACNADYARAKATFQKCYPEYDFKGFICNTWLLCPALTTFLKKDSNITLFQEPYHIFPAKNMAPDVFLYVYDKMVTSADEVDFAALPEDNSMRRGVKQLLLGGTYIHQYNGFIPF